MAEIEELQAKNDALQEALDAIVEEAGGWTWIHEREDIRDIAKGALREAGEYQDWREKYLGVVRAARRAGHGSLRLEDGTHPGCELCEALAAFEKSAKVASTP